jgi:hypothetical protein
MVTASNKSVTSKVSEKTLSIQGSVAVDAVYCADKKTMDTRSQNVELPINTMLQLPDNGNWQVVDASVAIEDVAFDIGGSDAIDVSVKLKIQARISKLEEIQCIDNAVLTRDENSGRKAPVIMYFTQPGDTLWDIAKRYRIPVDRLAQDNNLDAQAAPDVGKKMFIMA